MKLKKEVESKLKLDLKLTDEILDLKTIDTNIVINYLENQLKLREITATEKLKSFLPKNQIKQKVYK